MPGPWEKFGGKSTSKSAPEESGPWSNFQAPPEEQSPGLMDKASQAALRGLGYVGEKLDQYGGGAAARAGVGAYQQGKGLMGSLQAAKEQYGQDPSLAPTGKELVERSGLVTSEKSLSDVLPSLYSETGEGLPLKKGGMLDPTAKGAAGLVAETALDPLSVLPVGKMAKAAGSTAKGVLRGGASVAKGAAKVGTKSIAKATEVIGSTLTGVPRKEIETYITRYPEVQKMIKDYGGDVATAADEIRAGFHKSLLDKKQALGKQLGEVAKGLPTDVAVPVDKIRLELVKHRDKLNKVLKEGERSEIDELIKKLDSLAGDSRQLTPQDLFDVKEYLQENAKGAFFKDGQVFANPKSKDYQMAAKYAAREARLLADQISPTTSSINKELASIHKLDEVINKNLITPEKSHAALLSAGKGESSRSAKQLKRVGEVTGTKPLEQAENLAATERFASPALLPVDTTGKGAARMIGAQVAAVASGTGPAGQLVGLAATSPATLKAAIQTGKISADVIRKVTGATGEITEATIDAFINAVQKNPNITKGLLMAPAAAERQGLLQEK